MSTSSRRRALPLCGALALLFVASQGAAAVRQTGKSSCDGQTCYEVAVSCDGLAERHAQVRRFDGKGSRGTVVFSTGGSGRGRYNKLEQRRRTQNELIKAGFEVFQIEWLGDEGWLTGVWGSGFSRATCAYAEVLRWIVAERARNSEVVCAQGNSGGSIQSGYGLAVHGLEDLLDMVIMSGGPPVTRLDDYCFGDLEALRERRPPPEPRRLASTGRTLVDQALGWHGVGDHCKRIDEVPPGEAIELAQRDSLVSPSAGVTRDFDYPHTKVNFVESVDDRAAAQGRIYFDAVQSAKAWYEFPGDFHRIDDTEAGASKIVELFETECRAH